MKAIRTRVVVFFAVAVGFAVFAPVGVAAPPVLLSVGSVSRHPTATWTLPSGVKAKVVEVATSPATGSDGYFFFENVKAFDTLEDLQTSWTYTFQLDPGTYYVHVGGLDEPCFFAGNCPVREFSQMMTLEIRPDTYAVSLTKLGAGTGTVTANGATISECGAATCTTTFTAGTSAVLVAIPKSDAEFAGWAGACSGTSPSCTVTIDGPKSLSATFNKKSYSVSLTKAGNGTGTVTANGATASECGTPTCTMTFIAGTITTFVAIATPDSTFAGWAGGACSGTSPTCTVTVDGPTAVTATFSKKPPPPCVVPNVKRRTINAARTALKKAGCALGRVTYAYSHVKKGVVINQRPAPRTLHRRGFAVQVVVSKGPKRR